jgi:uracil phosphoribosyltransferase
MATSTAVDEALAALARGGVFQIQHPLVAHHVTRMRRETTKSSEFRGLVRKLAVLMAYEATKDLLTKPYEVQTPLAPVEGVQLRGRIGLIPILRAGLGMVDPVLDPMLATGGSATAALMTLREWGVPRVKVLSLIAAQEGVDAVASQFPEAQIYVCQIDPELNANKFIVPGLGDAGDRIFNTVEPQE